MSELRIGIAGYGVIGKRRRGCVDANPFMTTVAVCDKKFADDGNLTMELHTHANMSNCLITI